MGNKVEFLLFRATIHPDPDAPLLASKEPKPEILRATISEAPTATLRRGGKWHVGNVRALGRDALTFRLGRIRRTSHPQIDARGDFVDADLSDAPNAFSVVDIPLEVVAIGRNSKLAPTPDYLARSLAFVLTGSDAATQRNVVVEVAPINNPVNFLEELGEAYAVQRLWVETKLPNPWDTDSMWVRPQAGVMELMSASTAKTVWAGKALQATKPAVTEIIKSTAATGGDAGALVRDSEKSAPRPIKLRGTLASFTTTVDAEDRAGSAMSVLAGLRELYHRIRNGK